MGHQHGILREWGWLLSLLVQCNARMRQNCAGGYLCPWMSTYVGGADVWYFPAAEEDEAHEDYENVV